MAREFLDRGAHVAICACDQAQLDRAAADLHRRGGDVLALRCDVKEQSQVDQAVREVESQFDRIDILVNNAGTISVGPLELMNVGDYEEAMKTHFWGPLYTTLAALPGMRRRGGGRIINISSIGGKFYEPYGAWYHATKFAVEGFSDSLRIELKPFGIQVVIIEPGPIITEWNEIARDSLLEMSGSGDYAAYAKKAHAVLVQADKPGRASKPETVAKKIRKAATKKRPAARYPVGRGAGTITTSRDLTPDAIFDQVISRMYGSR